MEESMGAIYKFERDMLRGNSIYINKKEDNAWAEKHWHNYYEMIYYKKYSGTCTLNGEVHPIKNESLFLLSPKDFHKIETDKTDEQYYLIIAFNERMPDAFALDALTKGPFILYDISTSLASKLDELYAVFHSEIKHRDRYLRHLFNCVLIEILNSKSTVGGAESNVNPIVRESISVMLSDPTAELSLDFFAKKFNVTGAYFSRLFHSSTGISFKQYLISLRLEYAKQLLEEELPPIIDVCYECGFNTPSQFYRAFKGAYGTSPSAFRKSKKDL